MRQLTRTDVLAWARPRLWLRAGLIAAMDGLQLQWLSDPGHTDMAADFATLLETVRYRWGQ